MHEESTQEPVYEKTRQGPGGGDYDGKPTEGGGQHLKKNITMKYGGSPS